MFIILYLHNRSNFENKVIKNFIRKWFDRFS